MIETHPDESRSKDITVIAKEYKLLDEKEIEAMKGAPITNAEVGLQRSSLHIANKPRPAYILILSSIVMFGLYYL